MLNHDNGSVLIWMGLLRLLNHGRGFDYIGKPVPNMMKRVKIWIEMGYRVKIVTARAQNPELAIPPIQKWLTKHGLPDLEVTNS